jgi:hypothetical protein
MNVALPTFTFPLDQAAPENRLRRFISKHAPECGSGSVKATSTRSRRHRNDSGITLRALTEPSPSLTADRLAVQFAGAVTGHAPAPTQAPRIPAVSGE